MMNEIKCNYKTRFYVVNNNEMEFLLPHYDNIILIAYENIAEIWEQIYDNRYTFKEEDRELIEVLIESGVVY